uniref:(northern house mosquito) hypothetical protein n=1 Tax=Culex pipiens TaxID=7175 RepID=A0A8D8G2H2_CULPI
MPPDNNPLRHGRPNRARARPRVLRLPRTHRVVTTAYSDQNLPISRKLQHPANSSAAATALPPGCGHLLWLRPVLRRAAISAGLHAEWRRCAVSSRADISYFGARLYRIRYDEDICQLPKRWCRP